MGAFTGNTNSEGLRQNPRVLPQTDMSPEKTSRWPRGTRRETQHHSLLEKCKSKPQGVITSHLAECPSSRSLETINAGDGVEKREPSHTAGGKVNWCSHDGEQHGGSSKTKRKVTASGHTFRENSNVQRYTHPSVHCSAVCSSQDVEAICMSTDR